MSTWGPALFSDDITQDVRREYSALLSIGKSADEAEKILICHYINILDDHRAESDVFWLGLALCEWKKGRLSDFVKAKALAALKSGRNLELWRTTATPKNFLAREKVLTDLQQTLLSPMPPAKKIKKATVHHCPWRVGSLLAYRIVNNAKCLKDHPVYGKYALLRVVKIQKHPVSDLAPDACYNESMWVGLYGWIGDAVPSPEIVKHLEYIPIESKALPAPAGKTVDLSLLHTLPQESGKKIISALTCAFKQKSETCVQLDWLPSKFASGDITYINCDSSYQERLPDFFAQPTAAYTMTNFLSFDFTLSKRLESYLHLSE